MSVCVCVCCHPIGTSRGHTGRRKATQEFFYFLYLASAVLAFIILKKNLNATKKPPEQSKGLDGNFDCKDNNNSSWHEKTSPMYNHIGPRV